MSEIGVDLKNLVISRGFSIGMETAICDNHHKFVENCSGCDCEEGCSRYVHLMMAITKGMIYKPTSFEDSLKLDAWVQKQMSMALDKTIPLEQLKKEVI